ncbi:cAMP-independent regulatory protein pac2 [Diplocarpon rosae]|nr:cAMP-independent regulatory protein pac2 [Diplocarpon rosae]
MDTYYGHVRSPADAIKLFEACRLGLLPRVQRRLSEKERQSIKSGSVFVWDEREAGMRRWTDGKSWSASRVSGSFLTYREMEGKRGGGQFVPPPIRRPNGKTPDSGRGSDEDLDLDGEGPDGYRYKPDGLMKQSFSITTSTGQHLHLISYYSRPHPGVPDLPTPTTDPQLRHINPVKGMYPESTVHEAQGPAVTRTPMQQSPYMQHQPIPSPHRVHPPPPYGYQPGLVHATDSVSVISDNKSNSNGKVTVKVNSNGGSSRHGSHSPQAGGPNDIPHDKLNIGGVGEDQRAIRVLDKKFMI